MQTNAVFNNSIITTPVNEVRDDMKDHTHARRRAMRNAKHSEKRARRHNERRTIQEQFDELYMELANVWVEEVSE